MAGTAPHCHLLPHTKWQLVHLVTTRTSFHVLPQIQENYGFCELEAPPKSNPVATSPKFSAAVGQGYDDMLVPIQRLSKVFELGKHRLASEIGLLREAPSGNVDL